MFKALLYSDPHFCQYSSIVKKQGEKYSVRLHNLINSISWVEHFAEDHGCNCVICGGDFFNTSSLNAMEITALQDVYFSPKLNHVFLTGNHEANIANLDYSSANIFKSIKADIISEVKRIEVNDLVDLYYIPYLTSDCRLYLKDFIVNNNKKKVIISHNDLAGIQYGRFTSQSGFDVNDILENCNLFLNGHLHNSTVINDKIWLIGNLTGQNFNENAKEYGHYAYVLSIEDNGDINLNPVENPYAFNFYKLYITTPTDLNQLGYLKNNSVLSVSCSGNLITDVEKKLRDNPKVVEYRLLAMYNGSTDVETENFIVEDHLKQFIDYVQTKLESSQLLTEELTLLGEN